MIFELKMFTLNEEQRWFIIHEWKNGSKSVSEIARFLRCHISTVYRVINYYRCHHTVNYGGDIGRPPALDSHV
jgi:transposase